MTADDKKPATKRRQLTEEDYVNGVLSGDRSFLGRAITLIESQNAQHQKMAQTVLQTLLPHTGKAKRLGITGVPGVGKSTTIEAFGCNLIEAGLSVAVLAIDPSSGRTGGSILGDKTRMQKLGNTDRAFVRPSPSSGTLGGVTRKTRETMLLCEAAGYDVIIVETVGVGQSETTVAEMVDCFIVLMLPGAGDELQGIKKGVLEIADMIVVNKADGDNEIKARAAIAEYRNALHIMKPASPNWSPPVMGCSGLKNTGLDKVWEQVEAFHRTLTATGELPEKRRQQQLRWMWNMIENQLLSALHGDKKVADLLPQVEQSVLDGTMTPTTAVNSVLDAFGLTASNK